MRSARRRSRELAVQALYAWQVAGNPVPDLLAHAAESRDYDKADGDFLRALVTGAIREFAGLRTALEAHLERPWEGLSPVERAILLTAAYEFAHVPEVPYRAVINEAVEIAKSFGGNEGFRFVNGVLDRLARATRPDAGAAGGAA